MSARSFAAGLPLLAVAAAAGLALTLYRPALNGPFVSDDLHYVSDNAYVHTLSLDNVLAILDPAGNVAVDVVNYAPVQMLVHALAWSAFGAETFGHHVLNVLLHALSSVLLALLLQASGASQRAAWLAGAIFLVHPANVEAVAWVSQLKTNLALPLALGALLLLPRAAGWATVLFAASLLAKASAVCALPAAALLEWSRTGRVRRGWLAAWGLCFAVYAAIEFATHQRSGAADATLYLAPLTLVRTVAGLGARYWVQAASGWPTSAFHEPDPASSWLDPWWLLAVGLAGFGVWRVVVAWRARSPELAYWVWAGVAFAPISQVFPFLYPFADRYLYFILPGLLGGVLLAGQAQLAALAPDRRARFSRALFAVGLVLLVSLAARVPGRAAIWRSNTALLLDAESHYPDGKVANVLAAKRAAGAGDVEGAVAALRRAQARGFNRFVQLEIDASYEKVREAPAFRALVAEMAARWIESGRDKPGLTPMERRSIAHAHIARREPELALAQLDAALADAGPYTDALRREAEAIRAALAAGVPERVRLR